jgi:hypothetical protein
MNLPLRRTILIHLLPPLWPLRDHLERCCSSPSGLSWLNDTSECFVQRPLLDGDKTTRSHSETETRAPTGPPRRRRCTPLPPAVALFTTAFRLLDRERGNEHGVLGAARRAWTSVFGGRS